MRQTIYKEVQTITPLDDLETQHQTEVLNWIDSGAELCRIEKPATPPKHLVSYFVLVDGDYILLVNHKKAQLWLPTGGHVEPLEHPRTTVIREAEEELGIVAEFIIDAPLMLTSTQTVGTTAGHTDVSLWYVLKGNTSENLVFDQNEFETIHWFHHADIPYAKSDPHMKRFVEKLYSTNFD